MKSVGWFVLIAAVALCGGALRKQRQGVAVAQAAERVVLEGDCDIESGTQRSDEDEDGAVVSHRKTRYYAELDVSDYEPIELIGARFVLCELDEHTGDPPFVCSETDAIDACIGENPLPIAECVVKPLREIVDGKARVECGYNNSNDANGTLEVTDYKYESVKLVIP